MMTWKGSISGPVALPVFDKTCLGEMFFVGSMLWEPILANRCLEGRGTVVEKVTELMNADETINKALSERKIWTQPISDGSRTSRENEFS